MTAVSKPRVQGPGRMVMAIIAVLGCLLLILQYRLWFAEGSVIEVHRLQEQVAAEEQRLERLRERNAALEAEVDDLKQGLAAIEARARSELGMIGRDETFYLVVEPNGAAEDEP